MLIWKIAFRNVFRQKRRSLITVLMMFGGFVLASIAISWSDGTYANIINAFTRNRLGHIQIHSEDYLDKPTLYKTIDAYPLLEEKIKKLSVLKSLTPRAFSAGLASADEKSAGINIIGIDLDKENQTTQFHKKIIEGEPFSPNLKRSCILGKGLSQILNAKISNEIVVISQGSDGSMANQLYKVSGIIETGDLFSDQRSLYLQLEEMQELLALNGRIHEIAVVLKDIENTPEALAEINKLIQTPKLKVSGWYEFAKEFYQAMQLDRKGMWISLFIILLMVTIGVLNTVLMSVLEREKEYGLLRALGTKPSEIIHLILYEVGILSTIGIIAGSLLAFILIFLLSLKGIALKSPISYGGMQFQYLTTELNIRCFAIPAIAVFFSSLTISLLPALKAAWMDPARIMKN